MKKVRVLGIAAAFCLSAFCASAEEEYSTEIIDNALSRGTFNSVSVGGFVEAIDNPKLFGGTLSTEVVLTADSSFKLALEPSFKLGSSTYTETPIGGSEEEYSAMFFGFGCKMPFSSRLSDFLNLRIGLDMDFDVYSRDKDRTSVGITLGLLGGLELFPKNVVSFVLDAVPSFSDKGKKVGFECPVSLSARFNFWNLFDDRHRPKYHEDVDYITDPNYAERNDEDEEDGEDEESDGLDDDDFDDEEDF